LRFRLRYLLAIVPVLALGAAPASASALSVELFLAADTSPGGFSAASVDCNGYQPCPEPTSIALERGGVVVGTSKRVSGRHVVRGLEVGDVVRVSVQGIERVAVTFTPPTIDDPCGRVGTNSITGTFPGPDTAYLRFNFAVTGLSQAGGRYSATTTDPINRFGPYQLSSTYPVPGNGAAVSVTQSRNQTACPPLPNNTRFSLSGPQRTKKSRRVARDRTFRLFKRIKCPGAGPSCRVQIFAYTAAKRPVSLGRQRYRVAAKTSGKRLTGRISKRGLRRLRRHGRLKLRVFIRVDRSGRNKIWRHEMVLRARR
jgi:hypothetical protein